MYYCQAQDVYDVYGETNVLEWARVSSTFTADELTARVAWACRLAFVRLNNRLRTSVYAIPFTALDPELVDVAARLSGIILFDSRLISEPDGPDQVGVQRKEVDNFIRGVKGGNITLDCTTDEPTYPVAVDNYGEEEDA